MIILSDFIAIFARNFIIQHTFKNGIFFSQNPYKNKREKRFPAGSEKMGANGPKMQKP